MKPIQIRPHQFNASVTGIDLNNICHADVNQLKEAIWAREVLIIKGQHNLSSTIQLNLVARFEPDAPQVHSHGDIKTFQNRGGMLSKRCEVHEIPDAEHVRLIGKGYQGEDHFGWKDPTVRGLSSDFHGYEVPEEGFRKGRTGFQRWHIGAPLHDCEPAWFTTLRCVKQPAGEDVTIAWEYGIGLEMESRPGLTASPSMRQMYSWLSEEEQKMADHS